jgi:hypothetical protein
VTTIIRVLKGFTVTACWMVENNLETFWLILRSLTGDSRFLGDETLPLMTGSRELDPSGTDTNQLERYRDRC